MAIRYLAIELYRLEREVEDLRKKLNTAPPEARVGLEVQLRQTIRERDEMRSRLEDKKEKPTYTTKFR